MKAVKIILIVLLVIAAILTGVYAYYGGFKKIAIRTEQQGGEIIVYKEVVGNYNKTGEVSDEVYYSLLNDYGVETYKGIGIYYDKPGKTDKDKMRFDVGCILELKDTSKIEQIKNKYSVRIIPVDKYVVTEFPYKGMMSIMIGIIKVYPALNKYTSDNGIPEKDPVMEIYDIPNEKIIYRVRDPR